ncbi:uncharacterized protein LOC134527084 isoform X2 [Bacillus rossius redtenbacheri]|uniref:uncharacterized protein LOC134527084 isoform X2 n=1 Tax=Bacillus rossius redtenbacheri TaxID=93214 RepID=UPI002FDE60CF
MDTTTFDFNEDEGEEVASYDEDRRSMRFESKQKKKDKINARIPLTPNFGSNSDSDDSCGEEEILTRKKRLENEIKRLEEKLKKKREKNECEIAKCEKNVPDESAMLSPLPLNKEAGTDDRLRMTTLPCLDFNEEEGEVASYDEDKRNLRFESKQKKKAEKRARIPLTPNFGFNDPSPDGAPQECPRTRSQCSAAGPMYEVKVLALLYLRASHGDEDFLLGASVEAAGKFDDVRLVRGPRQMLVQLKHKDTRPLSKAQLLADEGRRHGFSLLKYFKSFCSLREGFDGNTVLSRHSRFADIEFVVCTDAAAVPTEGCFTDDDLTTPSDDILNMNGKVFNFARNQNLIQEFKLKHASDADDGLLKEFFDQFFIYSDQIPEKCLDKKLQDEIKEKCGISEYGANKFKASLVEYIKDWWGDKTCTRQLNGGEFKLESGLEILQELSVGSPKIEFKPEALSSIKKIISTDLKVINCVVNTDKCGPSIDKLTQAITETSVKYLSMTLEDIESSYEKILFVWPSKMCPILVINYEIDMPVLQKNISAISAQILRALDQEESIKIFLISNQGVLKNILFPNRLKSSNGEVFIKCEIQNLTKEYQERVSQSLITFQGSNVTIQSVLGNSYQHAIDENLLCLLTYGDKTVQLGSIQEEKPSFYINRVLKCNSFLKKSVLLSNSRNIFAVSGATDEQIQTILENAGNSEKLENKAFVPESKNFPNKKDMFGFEIMDSWYYDGAAIDSTVTADNLFLSNIFKRKNENDYLEKIENSQLQINSETNMTTVLKQKRFHTIQSNEEFVKLYKKYKYKNVHWLEFEDGNLRWKKSKGSWNVIKHNICTQTESFHVTNVWDIPNRIVVVTGVSGSGKSTLLSKIALNSKKDRPESCIIRINLRDCKTDLENLNLTITPGEACEFLIRNSMSLEENIQSSASRFFKYILTHRKRAVVLVDGFDEVYPENECMIVNLIKSLMKLRILKMWITSRQYMSSRLESITRTMAFELQPLTISESCDLIHHCIDNVDHDVLGKVPITTDPRLCQLLENPLNCKMLAEVAKSKTGIREKLLGRDSVISYLTILKAIVESKFEMYLKKIQLLFSENYQMHEISEMKERFIENHQWSALLHISSPNIVKSTDIFKKSATKRRLKDFVDAVQTGSGVTGIINTVRNGIPQFEHGMYVDYFLALWIMDNWHGTHKNAAKMILKRIIFDPRFSFVIQLFNLMTSKDLEFHTAILQINWNSTLPKILKKKKVREINYRDEAGRTALHLALSLWNTNLENSEMLFLKTKREVIGNLLRLGANPLLLDDILEWSPFRYSNIRTVPWGIVAVMMDKNGITNFDKKELIGRVRTQKLDALSGLAHGVSFGNRKLVSFLIKSGVDVNDHVNEMGDTALIIAATHGKYDILEFLHTEHNAKPDLRNNNDDSPLHWACLKGHISIVKYLINNCGILTDIKNKTNHTPLLAAARGGHWKIIKYLIDTHNSDPRVKTTFGQSALCLAAASNGDQSRMVKYLVEKCDLN